MWVISDYNYFKLGILLHAVIELPMHKKTKA